MRVLVVAEFYPRAADPVLGVWAHRQALAARAAGAEVRVVVLHRPVPPRALATDPRAIRAAMAQPRHATLDGLEIDYIRYLSPPRSRSYGSWGAWAAPALKRYLRGKRGAFDLLHAHNAVPAGDAVRRACGGDVPLLVSVHGGDVFHTAPRYRAGAAAVRATFGAARMVLANSEGIADAARELGAADVRVVRLGADLPAKPPPRRPETTLVTIGHLVGRKRHGDVLRALWLLRDRHPDLRYLVIGDGPEREPLERLAGDLGLAARVEFTGQLDHAQALARVWECSLLVMPSTDEAFGVAYVEGMAGGLPAIGSRGEPGPEEIARAGAGMSLVPPADVEALAAEITELVADQQRLRELGASARETVASSFTWEHCGEQTVAAYEDALR